MIRAVLLFLIRVYQLTLSRLIGPTCRFEPSCSHYTATCIERFGALARRRGWALNVESCPVPPVQPRRLRPAAGSRARASRHHAHP